MEAEEDHPSHSDRTEVGRRMEVGRSGRVHQKWENVGSGPRRDGNRMSESLSDPSVEEQLDGWVGSLEEVEGSGPK